MEIYPKSCRDSPRWWDKKKRGSCPLPLSINGVKMSAYILPLLWLQIQNYSTVARLSVSVFIKVSTFVSNAPVLIFAFPFTRDSSPVSLRKNSFKNSCLGDRNTWAPLCVSMQELTSEDGWFVVWIIHSWVPQTCVYSFVNDVNKRQACWVVNRWDKIFLEWRILLEINSYFCSSNVLAKWTNK